MDSITEKRIQKLHPHIMDDVFAIFKDTASMGLYFRLTSGLRTLSEQEKLYRQGRSAPGHIVTNAQAGRSWHNYGLAFDMVILKDGGQVSWDRGEDVNDDGKKDWQQFVDIAKNHGFEWGGDWSSIKDYPHFQKRFGLSIDEAKSRKEHFKTDDEGYILI